MNTAEQLKISIDDYLQGELISEIKHEYINGEVFAMAGAKRSHNILNVNLLRMVSTHLRGTPCHVYGGDMKVGILTNKDDFFYYPDLHVSCETMDNELYNYDPKLIIEILSDSTSRIDRIEKFCNYRQLNSLKEYVLIAQDSQRVEVYSQNSHWDLTLFTNDDKFYLESIDLHLELSEIYEDIKVIR